MKKKGPLGSKKAEKFDLGDIVSWSESKLTKNEQKYGLIVEFLTEKRGGRDIRMATVSLLENGYIQQVPVICLDLLSKSKVFEA